MNEEKSSKYGGAERRRFKRIRVNLVVVYREDDSLDVRIKTDSAEHQAAIIDISEEGIAVLSGVKIPVTTVLCVRFNLADNKKEGIDFYGAEDIKGKVIYSTALPPDHFRIGIQFYGLSSDDRAQIRNFVDILDKKFSDGD
ncbi:MAG: PilZ domain-containing protein [Candidatus Omnitrophota bacterium]|jgi:c-di-GMP-binding flagellar brake protein YcgR